MFLGEFQHTIDAKGRLSIPVKFREYINSQSNATVIITATPGSPCLAAYTKPEFDLLRENARKLQKDSNVSDVLRLFYKNATECSLDKQGRILIPPNLRKHADLEDNTLLFGVDHKFEIWKPEKWHEKELSSSHNEQEIATTLARLGM